MFLQKHRWLKRGISVFLLIAFLNLSIRCNYYLAHTYQNLSTQDAKNKMSQTLGQNKYFILHSGNRAYAMFNIVIDSADMSIHGTLDFIPGSHMLYVNNLNGNGSWKFKSGRHEVLNEIHIFTKDTAALPLHSPVTIPLASLTRLDIIDKNSGKTTVSYVLTTFGIVIGVFVLLLIIVALTKSSCPFIYVHNGESYEFTGEIYGGAVFPALERDDYMPLENIQPVNDQFLIKISNELKEKQYTDIAELMVITHNKNVSVLADKKGNVHTFSEPQKPVTALLDSSEDYSSALSSKDNASCLFNDDKKDFNNLYLTFDKKEYTGRAKLLLTAKNSLWLDYMYGEFTKLFGMEYNHWMKKEEKKPASELNQWSLSQGIPLVVSLKSENGWKAIDTIPAIDPLANRDLLIPVDLSRVKGDKAELKLSCGFMFWELDYAAMDFTADAPVKISYESPLSAVDESGNDVTASLQKADKKYLSQQHPGIVVDVKFNAPACADNEAQSVVLHTRGYYEHVRDYKGIPEIKYLQTFRQAGTFTHFSLQHYRDISGRMLFTSSH